MILEAKYTRKGSVVYMSTSEVISIFVSYTDEDLAFRQDLEKRLQTMQRQQVTTCSRTALAFLPSLSYTTSAATVNIS